MWEEFKKFLMTGVFCTILNFILFYVFFKWLHFSYSFSYCIGFLSGVIFGFQLNRKFTFKVQEQSKKMAVKYLAVYTFSLIAGFLFLNILVKQIELNPVIANIFTLGVTTMTNFSGLKFWTFKYES